jgi:hypothetical protein
MLYLAGYMMEIALSQLMCMSVYMHFSGHVESSSSLALWAFARSAMGALVEAEARRRCWGNMHLKSLCEVGFVGRAGVEGGGGRWVWKVEAEDVDRPVWTGGEGGCDGEAFIFRGWMVLVNVVLEVFTGAHKRTAVQM